MEFESIKRLGLDHIGIDTQKSFGTYNQDTNNHIIIIHLLKSKNIVCPLCGSYFLELKGLSDCNQLLLSRAKNLYISF